MCILFVWVCRGGGPSPPKGAPPVLRLVLASNRDETYARPTRLARFWDSDPHILAGQDLEEGGTWLGVSRRGKLGVLLNIMGPKAPEKRASRGDLVTGFLRSPLSAAAFAADLHDNHHIDTSFGGFSLLTVDLADPPQLTYLTNACGDEGPRPLEGEGTFGFGNSVLEKPFCKVREGCSDFQSLLRPFAEKPLSAELKEQLEEELLRFLSSTQQHFPDPQMEEQSQGTSVPPSMLPELSSLFVKSPLTGYGTRTHTVVIVDSSNHVTFHEWTMKEPIDSQNPAWIQSKFEFQVEE